MANETTINIRANSRVVSVIDQAANTLGQTRSTFLRDAAEAEARKILSRPRDISACPLCGR